MTKTIECFFFVLGNSILPNLKHHQQKTTFTNLVTSTEEILNGKLHFLRKDSNFDKILIKEILIVDFVDFYLELTLKL